MMALPVLVETLGIDAIDATDRRYAVSTAGVSEALCLSIEALGLLIPPLVRGDRPPFTILSGFRRFDAVRRSGGHSIAARFAPSHCDPLWCARAAVAENALQRPLNLIEQGRSLELLAGCCNTDELPRMAAACGLNDSLPHAAKLRSLLRLPMPVQKGVLEETIAFPVALVLGALPPDTANRFAALFAPLKLSLNKQRQILDQTMEIAHREGISPEAVLDSPPLREHLDDPHLDRNRKGTLLRSTLRRRRYPGLVAAEHAFKETLSRIPLGEGLRLDPPPDFEGTAFTLSQTFHSFEEFQRQRRQIDRLARHPAFPSFF